MGIAFFMWRSRAAESLQERLFAARYTVAADYIFTLPAVIVQPLTGFWLIHAGGFDPGEFWLVATYALFALLRHLLVARGLDPDPVENHDGRQP